MTINEKLPHYDLAYVGAVKVTSWENKYAGANQHIDNETNHMPVSGQVDYSRDPTEPIQAIIHLQHPISALVSFTTEMEKELPSEKCPQHSATYMRDLLLVKLFITNPLRLHQFSIMTYRKDNTGNLYQTPDGAWWLQYQPADFINKNGEARTAYSVRLVEWVWPAIEEYLQIYRPRLSGADVTDFVFRPRAEKSGKASTQMLRPGQLGAQLHKLTHKFIPNFAGLRAHAFRHIIRTGYINNYPKSNTNSAVILNDTMGIAMSEYAHLQNTDEHGEYKTYLTGQVNAHKGSLK